MKLLIPINASELVQRIVHLKLTNPKHHGLAILLEREYELLPIKEGITEPSFLNRLNSLITLKREYYSCYERMLLAKKELEAKQSDDGCYVAIQNLLSADEELAVLAVKIDELVDSFM